MIGVWVCNVFFMEKIDFLIEQIGFSAFYIKLGLGILLSFLICYFTIPTVVKISHKKNLMDEPGERSSHERKIPNLGGIAIFYSLGLCAPVLAYQLFDLYKFLFPSLLVLVYVGVMDDIMIIRAYKKLFAQLLVIALLVVGSDIRLGNLFGLFGIYELSYMWSILFTIAFFVLMINAFNLIDGIDGLAGSYAIICCTVFGLSYFRLGPYNYPLVILCAIIIGSLLAFLRYNLSNGYKKIFMGDTGSMVIGFLLCFTAVIFVNIFIDHNNAKLPKYHLQSIPAIAVALFILPIVDTINVIVIRLSRKQSPFTADKSHVHHTLLRLGYSHKKSSLCILLAYLLIIGITYMLRHTEVNLLMAMVLLMGFVLANLPRLMRYYQIKQQKKQTPLPEKENKSIKLTKTI
jgi:UDP-GlcNAc:undecaprenyl-phosphate/decaprenyl-phosphate GlcNAc-1-phosphate transferase